MKKTMRHLIWIMALMLVPALAHADACMPKDEGQLLQTFSAPIHTCEDPAHPGYRSIAMPPTYMTPQFKLTKPLDVPDNTRIYYGYANQPKDPYGTKIVFDPAVKGYAIKLGNNSELSNLDIQYPKSTPATPLIAIVVVAGNSNTIKGNQIAGSAAIGVMVGSLPMIPGSLTTLGNYNVVGANTIVAEAPKMQEDGTVVIGGTGIFVIGLQNTIVFNLVNTPSDKTLAGKTGLVLFDWPQLIVANNTIVAGPAGKAFTFNDSWMNQPIPIGIAANLIGSNYTLDATKKAVPFAPADTNFEEYFKKPLSSMPTCVGKDSAPYYDDGTCKQVVTCQPTQSFLPNGSCGCVAGTALDPDLKVCVKTTVKDADKITCPEGTTVDPTNPTGNVCIKVKVETVTVDVIKTLEATTPTAGGDSGGDCSLVPSQTNSALAPVGILFLIVGLTGASTYRKYLRTQCIREKHNKENI